MAWDIEYTDEFGSWYEIISDEEQERVRAAVGLLEERGPALGRPLVDTLTATNIANLKELRPPSSTIRILFAFGPIQAAILLLGGDKSGEWEEWYRREIPIAEKLYTVYLDELKQEGLI